MTTTRANAEYLEQLGNTRDVISQAHAEGLVIRGQMPTWRENALERAGDYALAGEWSESRRMARQFVTGE
jgi:hypothetical protein